MKKKIILIASIVAVLILAIALLLFFKPLKQAKPVLIGTIKIGDYVTFGSYYGEPILWKCVDTENGVMLLSEDILCLKAYDAAESGTWGGTGGSYTKSTSKQQYGNNEWKNSNIREWLNSDADSVNFTTQPPVEAAILGGNNAYADEPGFLTNFTEAERALILPVSHDGCKDKVFILSYDEVHKYICDGDSRDSDSIRMLTDAAKNNCEHDGSLDPGNDWWYYTRSPSETESKGKTLATFGGGAYYYFQHIFYGISPGTGTGGVLPALTLKSDVCKSGDGTIESPWVLQ
jgi:hypothetical protein